MEIKTPVEWTKEIHERYALSNTRKWIPTSFLNASYSTTFPGVNVANLSDVKIENVETQWTTKHSENCKLKIEITCRNRRFNNRNNQAPRLYRL